MPRPIKPADPIKRHLAMALSIVADAPYPGDASVLYEIVQALLDRIESRDPDDAMFCRSMIQLIAALDRDPTTTYTDAIDECLLGLLQVLLYFGQ